MSVNWVQHWVSQIGLFLKALYFSGFLCLYITILWPEADRKQKNKKTVIIGKGKCRMQSVQPETSHFAPITWPLFSSHLACSNYNIASSISHKTEQVHFKCNISYPTSYKPKQVHFKYNIPHSTVGGLSYWGEITWGQNEHKEFNPPLLCFQSVHSFPQPVD